MRNITFFVAILLMGTACSQKDDVQEEGMDATPVVAVAPAVTETESVSDPDAYYEYLWCNQGDDFSQEKFAELTANWNSVIDGLDAPALAAFGYIPRDADIEAYDGLWAVSYTTSDAADE